MNDKEKSLHLAAAGYPPKRMRRTRISILLTSEMKFALGKIALDSFGGHRRKASEMLGITEQTLYNWLRKM
jgi:DNA-binding NtrC family response regulator